MNLSRIVTATMLIWVALLQAVLAEEEVEKRFSVVPVNTESAFMMHIDVNSADRTYREGESMRVRVKAERDCYLYLLYYDATKQCVCLFPNKYQKENLIHADEIVEIPGPNADYTIDCQPPFGTEVLKAVGTLQPVDIFKQGFLTKEIATPLKKRKIESMAMRLKQKEKKAWAETQLEIATRARTTQSPPRQATKYGVYIGISSFQSRRIPPLRVSHKDAERMAEVMSRVCGVKSVAVLTNQKATRSAIEKAIFKDLVAVSKPGDTVYLFFSGHGGRCPDDNGDEKDGYDEYLVPYEGILGKPETMVLDDAFARWMQALDGRRVAIIFDCCYSGGSSKGVTGKGLPSEGDNLDTVDFFDGEIRRSKDLGQRSTMVLAACQANQVAWEMPSKDAGSVLTHFFLAALEDARVDADGNGEISLGEIYRLTKPSIEAYVKKTFNADQNPLLIDNADDSIVVRMK